MERPIKDILVERRHRRDFGNVQELANSIADVGLLQPVAVTPDNKLVAGERRLAAMRLLERETVPVHVVEGLEDYIRLVHAERAENVCRKDFLPTEAVSIAATIEQLLKPQQEAKQKAQGEHGKEGGRGNKKDENPSGKLPEGLGRTASETRTKVAEAVGMKGRTLAKAAAVVKAAEAENAARRHRSIDNRTCPVSNPE